MSIRIHPLTNLDARAMIETTKGYPLWRAPGAKPVDLAFLESPCCACRRLVGDLEDELAEARHQPLIVTGDRKGSFVVDARIALALMLLVLGGPRRPVPALWRQGSRATPVGPPSAGSSHRIIQRQMGRLDFLFEVHRLGGEGQNRAFVDLGGSRAV